MRTRAVAFFAFTVTATAFLVGAGLHGNGTSSATDPVTRVGAFYVLAFIGTGLFVATLVLLLLTTLPAIGFRFSFDPVVLANWVDGDTPAPSKLVLIRKLVRDVLPTMTSDNERSLRKVRWFYRGLLVVGSVGLILWTLLVWMFA